MPEKSIREMNKLERQHYSLAARTFRATVMGAIVLGMAALLIGLGLYAYALGGQYVGEAFNLSRTVEGVIGKVVDVEPLADEVMQRYRGMTEEQRTGDEAAYRAVFEGIEEREDYRKTVSLLGYFLETSDVFDVYIAMFDLDTLKIVYVADPEEDPEYACPPGTAEVERKKGITDFMDWDGTGHLYDIERTDKYGWLATAGVPMRRENGEIYAFVLADVSIGNIANRMKSFVWQYALMMFILVNTVAILMARHMKKKLVQPINLIAEAAEAYAADKRGGIAGGDHFSKLGISTGDEVENLALIMKDMEADLGEYESNLTKITAEKERVGAELALATRIQADMLPNIFPAFPGRPEFDVFATMNPAKEVGGDFYDFFLIDENRLGLVMADVSGKGVPAALFMMISKILVQNYAMTGRSPKEVLESVNAQICANNREEMFVTVWFGILDLETGVLTAANAGHEYPVLKKPEGSFEIVKDRHGFVIGGMSGVKYREYELRLEPGSKLFLYTDGVPEATDAEGRLFGTDRMTEALRRAENGTPAEILGAVDDAVRIFVGDAPQFDDLTMLCVHYIGKNEKEGPNVKKKTLDAIIESIPELTEFIDAELEAAGCSFRAQTQIDVAIDEIFSNIARYAYPAGGGQATVSISIDGDPKVAVLTFTDSGIPYDPLKADDPDTTLSAQEREAGGLGVFIVKKTMDDVLYEYRDGCNVLTLKKTI